MNLATLKSIFSANGCQKVFVKTLSANDNSKNQVYLSGSFDILNIFPISEIREEPAGDWEKERFKASIRFSWITEEGSLSPAPETQFILYPKYPEVRLSGFLKRSDDPPSELMTQRLPGRLLFLSVSGIGHTLGFVAAPDSEIANEFRSLISLDTHGVFRVLVLPAALNSRSRLINELRRIHYKGQIPSKRLNKSGEIIPCNAPQCGGYTLEAELGVIPNGFAQPDYLGWEIKQFGVSNFERLRSAVITLMTPEPTHGYYARHGVEAFVRKYGYKDLAGRADRMNFGGIHKTGVKHSRTGLLLTLDGFDPFEGRIKRTDGRIALVTPDGVEAASWNFTSLLKHWNEKHEQACYVPSICTRVPKSYAYGPKVILGTGTDFQFFLSEMARGNVYYDPGIKIENISTVPKGKHRSQFRIKSGCLHGLYKKTEVIDLTETNH